MYIIQKLTKYKGYVLEPYYHSHLESDKQWGYRIWKGYELLCVNEVGCKSLRDAIKAAIQEIDKGFICRLYS